MVKYPIEVLKSVKLDFVTKFDSNFVYVKSSDKEKFDELLLEVEAGKKLTQLNELLETKTIKAEELIAQREIDREQVARYSATERLVLAYEADKSNTDLKEAVEALAKADKLHTSDYVAGVLAASTAWRTAMDMFSLKIEQFRKYANRLIEDKEFDKFEMFLEFGKEADASTSFQDIEDAFNRL